VIGGSRLATNTTRSPKPENGWQTVNANYVGGSRLSSRRQHALLLGTTEHCRRPPLHGLGHTISGM